MRRRTRTGPRREPSLQPAELTPLLDLLASIGEPAPRWALSLVRKLRIAYVGPAFRVIRASDSTSLDVGFMPTGVVNFNPLLAFIAGTTAVIDAVYDQSGNGINFTQGTAASRPTITNGAGVLQRNAGGKVAVAFDGVNDTLNNAAPGVGMLGGPALSSLITAQNTGPTGRRMTQMGISAAAGSSWATAIQTATTFAVSCTTGFREFTPLAATSAWFLARKAAAALPSAFRLMENSSELPQALCTACATVPAIALANADWGAGRTGGGIATPWGGLSNCHIGWYADISNAAVPFIAQEMARYNI